MTYQPKSKKWTPFLPATMDRLDSFEKPSAIWKNSRYTVVVYELENPKATHLSIKRNDRLPVHDWRDLQRIKNEICGKDREGLEIYPSESRLTDTANQYHLFVLPQGMVIPFGFFEGRIVAERESAGAKQRPFEKDNRPDDLLDMPNTLEEIEAGALKDELKARRQKMIEEMGLPKDEE